MKIPTGLTHFIRFTKRRIKCNRSYSAIADSNSNEENVQNVNTEVIRNTSVTNYLKSIGSESIIQHLIPAHIHPRSKKVHYHYLVNEKTAEEFASLIVNKLSSKELNCVVAECNPTFGLLTKKLLEKGVPKLHLYETQYHEKGPLVDLLKNNQDRLVLHPIQFLKFWTLTHDDEFQKSFAQERQLTEWDEDVSMIVIAALSDLRFIYNVMMSIVKRNISTEYGRFKMFLVMRPSDWTVRFCCFFSNRKNTCLFYIFCFSHFNFCFRFSETHINKRNKEFVSMANDPISSHVQLPVAWKTR